MSDISVLSVIFALCWNVLTVPVAKYLNFRAKGEISKK